MPNFNIQLSNNVTQMPLIKLQAWVRNVYSDEGGEVVKVVTGRGN